MNMQIFYQAHEFTSQREGKISMDPHDPGNWTGGKVGKGNLVGTNKGISAAAYPDLDIMGLSDAEIRALYFRDYWLRSGAARFAKKYPALACRLYDLSVNCGVTRASKFLQRGVNTVCTGYVAATRQAPWRQAIARITNGKPLLVDGKVGPITAAVITACPHDNALHAALCGEAYNHYKEGDPGNIAGWLNRLNTPIILHGEEK